MIDWLIDSNISHQLILSLFFCFSVFVNSHHQIEIENVFICINHKQTTIKHTTTWRTINRWSINSIHFFVTDWFDQQTKQTKQRNNHRLFLNHSNHSTTIIQINQFDYYQTTTIIFSVCLCCSCVCLFVSVFLLFLCLLCNENFHL